MPMTMVELPQDVVVNARRYAESVKCDFAHMVAVALKKVYGIESVYGVQTPSLATDTKPKTYRDMFNELNGGELSREVKSLVGVAKLRPEDEGKSHKDIITDALWEKYEALK